MEAGSVWQLFVARATWRDRGSYKILYTHTFRAISLCWLYETQRVHVSAHVFRIVGRALARLIYWLQLHRPGASQPLARLIEFSSRDRREREARELDDGKNLSQWGPLCSRQNAHANRDSTRGCSCGTLSLSLWCRLETKVIRTNTPPLDASNVFLRLPVGSRPRAAESMEKNSRNRARSVFGKAGVYVQTANIYWDWERSMSFN